MAEKILIAQALDERELLIKKIGDKIENAHFVDTIKQNEEKTMDNRLSRKEFAKTAESAYQQIVDLIDRFQAIDAAIIESNATTKINTSYGEMSVASAISLRNRLRGKGAFAEKADFEGFLIDHCDEEYDIFVQRAESKNKQLQSTAENMRLSILGKDSKVKDDQPLKVVDEYIKENTTEVIDPLGVKKKVEELTQKRDTLISELDTGIKVSNATTFIEV